MAKVALQKIQDAETREFLKRNVAQIVQGGRVKAGRYLNKLQKSGQQWVYGSGDIDIQSIIGILSLAALPVLDEDRLIGLFTKNVAVLFKSDELALDDFIESIEAMVLFLDYDSQQKRKNLIYCALNANQETLTENNFTIQGKGVRKIGCISDWIQDFIFFMRNEKQERSTQLLMEAYLNTSINGKKLTKKQRESVRKLLGLIIYSAQAVTTPLGYIGDIMMQEGDHVKIISKGKTIHVGNQKKDTPQRKKEVSSQNKLTEKWADFEAGELFRNIERQRKVYIADFSKATIETMYDAINAGDPVTTIAVLAAITEQKKLRETFEHNERYATFWGKHIESHWQSIQQAVTEDSLDQTTAPADKGAMLGEFKLDPAAPRYLALFLHEVLVEKMKLGAQDAVLLGIYIGNIARGAGDDEYAGIAYGELESGTFEWNFSK